MKRFIAVGATVVVAVSYAGPIAAADSADGAVVIPLVSDTGEVTDAARAGFDLSATADNGEPAEADSASARSITKQSNFVDFVLSAFTEQASDKEIASELHEDYVLFTNPIAIDDPFAVAGVTWDSGYSLPNGSSIQMRTLDMEGWSDWYILEAADDGPANSRPGTEYNISGASSAIQVRITRGEGDLPAGLRVDVSYSTDGDVSVNDGDEVAEVLPDAESLADEPVNSESASTSAAINSSIDTMLTSVTATDNAVLTSSVSISTANIQPRSAWGADESLMTWPEEYADYEGVIIHHTAGSNTYAQNDVASVIRGIYQYHAVTLGWGDIGYNVLIDRFGGRWEGRSGTLASSATEMVIGGHAKPRNTGTMGVSVMGNFSGVNPNNAIITALEDVIAWKFIDAGVDPSSESPLTVPDSKSSASNLVVGSSLPRISGHLDVYWTECPARIYNYLDQIRNIVAKRFDESLTRLYLNDNWTGTANIAFWWGSPSDEVLVGDWDGDGVDTIALRRGNLYAFADEAIPTSAPVFTVSYGKANDAVVVGDWDGDGVDTLAVRRGNHYYVKNSISSGSADKIVAYGKTSDAVLIGDWDGDGVDTLTVRRGNLYYIQNSITATIADRVIAYGKVDDETYAGRFSATAKGDSLMVRRNNHYYISYSVHGGEADMVLAYGRVSDQTLVGDWNADGVDSLGVRRTAH